MHKLNSLWERIGILRYRIEQTNHNTAKMSLAKYEDLLIDELLSYKRFRVTVWSKDKIDGVIKSFPKKYKVYAKNAEKAIVIATNSSVPRAYKGIAEEIEEKNVPDLFESIEDTDEKLQKLLMDFGDCDTYDKCNKLLYECRRIGYNFDYDLDASPYNLIKMKDLDIWFKDITTNTVQKNN